MTKKKLIIETDIGGDPDDFYAILYLLHTCDVKAILVSPGNNQQIQVVQGILKYCNKTDVLVGSPLEHPKDVSVGSVVKWFMDRNDCPLKYESSNKILKEMFQLYPDIHFFGCGPIKSIGKYFIDNKPPIDTLIMQGGFVQYSIYKPEIFVEKFVGLEQVPTFNLNGYIPGADYITHIDSNIKNRYFVGKNVCHSMILNKNIYDNYKKSPTSKEMELFNKGIEFLVSYTDKKFHDPVAACIYNNLDIGMFVKGYIMHNHKKEWTCIQYDDGYNLCVDLNRELLWNKLFNME